MSKPDWKDAPEWAGVLVEHKVHRGTFAWVEDFSDRSRLRVIGTVKPNEFTIITSWWELLERRP